ncbi:hypothetical protein PIB30_114284, partial [Stylosanthes scabra]|nr:hypothetical protein [Stylosanthes scabra]
ERGPIRMDSSRHMPGIDPNFSSHKLSILPGSKPVAQRLRRMSPEKMEEVKK